jgi:hypothetical protein
LPFQQLLLVDIDTKDVDGRCEGHELVVFYEALKEGYKFYASFLQTVCNSFLNFKNSKVKNDVKVVTGLVADYRTAGGQIVYQVLRQRAIFHREEKVNSLKFHSLLPLWT